MIAGEAVGPDFGYPSDGPFLAALQGFPSSHQGWGVAIQQWADIHCHETFEEYGQVRLGLLVGDLAAFLDFHDWPIDPAVEERFSFDDKYILVGLDITVAAIDSSRR